MGIYSDKGFVSIGTFEKRVGVDRSEKEIRSERVATHRRESAKDYNNFKSSGINKTFGAFERGLSFGKSKGKSPKAVKSVKGKFEL